MSIRIDGTNTAANPGITGADADTGLQFGTDEVNIVTGGAARAKVDSSGQLLVGASTGRTNFYNGAAPIRLQVECNGGVGEISGIRNENNANGGTLILGKSRGTTIGSNTIVQNGDELGGVYFQGGDGTNLVDAAKVQGFIDGTPASGSSMPGRLSFSTTASGTTVPSERMRIRADGATVTTGTTILFGGSGTAGTPRSIAFGSNEIAWTGVGSGGTNMFLNLCDSAGNNGSSYALIFRGLASTGSVPATLSSVNFDCTSFTANGIYNQSTVAGANVHVSSGGTLYRSTSSIKFKTDVETIEDTYSDALLQCRPVWYRSTAIGDAAHPDWGYWGFIAEEVAKIDPRLVFWKTHETTTDIDGDTITEELAEPVPEGVQYDRFVPHLLNLIKRQKEQIETQGSAIAALEARLTALEGGAAQ